MKLIKRDETIIEGQLNWLQDHEDKVNYPLDKFRTINITSDWIMPILNAWFWGILQEESSCVSNNFIIFANMIYKPLIR